MFCVEEALVGFVSATVTVNELVTNAAPGTALCVAYVVHDGGVVAGPVVKEAGVVLFWLTAAGMATVELPSTGCVSVMRFIGFSNLFMV